ncbi:hypothetical protein BDK51DRAFT_32461 [Blyttiomyces helicus]|uniref:Uncharacterized protein n=1 Tax=Blyttiomyces helicus TaxID=388810 RepID=A0A4P9VYX4_9FUNG|nr:hypothetical protein BDK51DRAFT_32461 [Blyttiomyces helicus]|eukprot:RKO84999.1 hypothetical protein BDK51DRAFT_32461 [Blyttiomyces helicus]
MYFVKENNRPAAEVFRLPVSTARVLNPTSPPTQSSGLDGPMTPDPITSAPSLPTSPTQAPASAAPRKGKKSHAFAAEKHKLVSGVDWLNDLVARVTEAGNTAVHVATVGADLAMKLLAETTVHEALLFGTLPAENSSGRAVLATHLFHGVPVPADRRTLALAAEKIAVLKESAEEATQAAVIAVQAATVAVKASEAVNAGAAEAEAAIGMGRLADASAIIYGRKEKAAWAEQAEAAVTAATGLAMNATFALGGASKVVTWASAAAVGPGSAADTALQKMFDADDAEDDAGETVLRGSNMAMGWR